MIALDTNVLVYAHRQDSPFHTAASKVLRDLADGRAPWALPWPCLHEFLAVVTHPRIYRPASSAHVALEAVGALLALPQVHVLSESSDHAEIMAELMVNPAVVGPKVHDARIAAICLGHGVSALWTVDRDFSWFPALTVTNPLAQGTG